MVPLVFSLVSHLYSWPIHITGQVIDSVTLIPIVNAQVSVVGFPTVISKTNDSGFFVFDGSVSVASNRISNQKFSRIEVIGNNLSIAGIMTNGIVSVTVFNLLGVQLKQEKRLACMGSVLNFTNLWNTPGLHIIRIQTEETSQFIKVYSTVNLKSSFVTQNFNVSTKLEKLLSTYSIEIYKPNYYAKTIFSSNDSQDVGIIKLNAIPSTINYTPLAVGDYRQFILLPDSSTVQHEIVETRSRSDGKTVFVETYQVGNGIPDTFYLYSDGQFLISCISVDTTLDTSGNKYTSNPYGEQRLALKAPIENQYWFQYKEDTTQIYRVSKSYGNLETSLGLIQNAFGFELYNFRGDSLPFMTVCFANDAGWITTFYANNPDSIMASPVYIHTEKVDWGAMIPKRDGNIVLSKKNKRMTDINQSFFVLGHYFQSPRNLRK